MNNSKDTDVLIALAVFAAGIIASIWQGFSLVIPMAIGFVCFTAVGVHRGRELKELLEMSKKGFVEAMIVTSVILMIGLVTGTWRSSGVIALFVDLGIKMITPQIFILLAFLLCAFFSYAMGTSFGVVGTLGVILMSLAKAGDVNTAVIAGAVLSGAYFGDRFSPVSSSMLLTAAVTGTKPENNLPLMAKTMIIPVILTLAGYAVISFRNPISHVDSEIAVAIENGLQFKVQGFKFRGIVEVVYNEGRDLFDVRFLKANKVVNTIEGVFFDMLVDTIDDFVEKTSDYEQRVAAEYSIKM